MVYGSDATRATWLRDGASLLLPGGFLPRANAQGQRASDGPVRRPGRRSRPGGRRRRREGEREHRPHRCPDHLRPRAQPRRAATADVALRRAQVPDRAAGRRGRDPVHHLPRLPAGDGRPARPVHRLQAGGRCDGGQRVRDGRLPGALDGPRRDGAERARRHVERRAAGVVRGARDRRGARRGDGDAGRTAQPRLRLPRTCWSRSGWARSPRASPGSASTRTTSRSTTRCAACCSRCPSRRRPTPARAWSRS